MSTKTWLGIFCVVGFSVVAACSGGGHSSTSRRDGGVKDMTSTKDSGGGGSKPDLSDEGGSIGPAACTTTPDPCGGTIEGTWVLDEDCSNDPIETQCPSWTVTTQQRAKTILVFQENGTFTLERTGTQKDKVSFQLSCWDGVTEVQTCRDVFTPESSAACVGTSSCVCSFEDTYNDTYDGSFTTSGANASLAFTGEAAQPLVYCAQGTKLWFYFNDDTNTQWAMHRCPLSGC